jgi:hypothetical protein
MQKRYVILDANCVALAGTRTISYKVSLCLAFPFYVSSGRVAATDGAICGDRKWPVKRWFHLIVAAIV